MDAEATQNATQERLASTATALILAWSTILVDHMLSATPLATGLSAAAEVATEEIHTLDAEWSDAAATTIVPLIGLALTPSVLILASAPATIDHPAHRSPLVCQGKKPKYSYFIMFKIKKKHTHIEIETNQFLILDHMLPCAAVHLALRVTLTPALAADLSPNLNAQETLTAHQHSPV